MQRRTFLAGAFASSLLAKSHSHDCLSVIADEIGSLDDAFAFAREFQLRHLEFRGLEKMSDADARQLRKRLDDSGISCSFLNCSLLKFPLPGTEDELANKSFRPGTYTAEKRFAERDDQFRRDLEVANILGCRAMRTFSFSRVKEPASVLPRLADVLGPLAETARKSHVRLHIENEASTNIATSREAVALLERLPHLLLNWDPQNSIRFEPDVFPIGYALLPKKRIGNVQVKAEGLLGLGHPLDWAAILRALDRDHYSGNVGLETHWGKRGPERLGLSRDCMKKLTGFLT